MKAGADVNATTTDGTTPLHYLVCRNPSDAKAIQQIGRAIDLLLLKGADINLANKHGETPIFHSVSYGNFDIMLILIAKGADLTRRTGYVFILTFLLPFFLPPFLHLHHHLEGWELRLFITQ